jgi:hypothetical protein
MAAALLTGPAWGYALSSLVLLGFWAGGVRSPAWLLAAPAVAIAAAWLIASADWSFSLTPMTRRDLAGAAAVALVVLLVVALPYAHVGSQVAEGRAYRAYFTADFVWAMAVVSEVSKGDVPPLNPYLVGDSLHYYWLMQLLPAAVHRALGAWVRLEQVLLVNALWTGLTFAGFFYFFVRQFVARPVWAAIACAGVITCASFEGFDRIWAGVPFEALRVLNIDAVDNWSYQGMKIDGLQRLLLYQPQHQIGYLLGLSALLILAGGRDAARPLRFAVAGGFLGVSMLFSSFAAGILGVAAGIYATVRLVQARQWHALIPCGLAAALPIAAALALSVLLRYVDTSGTGNPLVRIGANRLAFHRVSWILFLNFGAVGTMALLGVLAAIRGRTLQRFIPIAIVVAVCAIFYFWVDVPDHDSVYVAWRASHLTYIALAPLCAFALQEGWRRRGVVRWLTTGLALTIAAAALPTTVVDVYNAQDVWNRAMGPGFRWTVILSDGEQEALSWMMRTIPPAARLQVDPRARGRDTWAYLPAFGERRMAGGLPIGMIPVAKYEKVSDQVKAVFAAESAPAAHGQALTLCIDYLVVGDAERRANARVQALIDGAPDLFRVAFKNDAVGVYAISGSWEQPHCPH